MQAAGQAGPKILFDLSRGKGASGAEIYAAGLETQGAKRRPEALSESDSGGETIQGVNAIHPARQQVGKGPLFLYSGLFDLLQDILLEFGANLVSNLPLDELRHITDVDGLFFGLALGRLTRHDQPHA